MLQPACPTWIEASGCTTGKADYTYYVKGQRWPSHEEAGAERLPYDGRPASDGSVAAAAAALPSKWSGPTSRKAEYGEYDELLKWLGFPEQQWPAATTTPQLSQRGQFGGVAPAALGCLAPDSGDLGPVHPPHGDRVWQLPSYEPDQHCHSCQFVGVYDGAATDPATEIYPAAPDVASSRDLVIALKDGARSGDAAAAQVVQAMESDGGDWIPSVVEILSDAVTKQHHATVKGNFWEALPTAEDEATDDFREALPADEDEALAGDCIPLVVQALERRPSARPDAGRASVGDDCIPTVVEGLSALYDGAVTSADVGCSLPRFSWATDPPRAVDGRPSASVASHRCSDSTDGAIPTTVVESYRGEACAAGGAPAWNAPVITTTDSWHVAPEQCTDCFSTSAARPAPVECGSLPTRAAAAASDRQELAQLSDLLEALGSADAGKLSGRLLSGSDYYSSQSAAAVAAAAAAAAGQGLAPSEPRVPVASRVRLRDKRSGNRFKPVGRSPKGKARARVCKKTWLQPAATAAAIAARCASSSSL